jgi:hypothetical protein
MEDIKKNSYKKKGQISVEMLAIVGVIVLGSLIFATYYLSSVNRHIDSASELDLDLGTQLSGSQGGGGSFPAIITPGTPFNHPTISVTPNDINLTNFNYLGSQTPGGLFALNPFVHYNDNINLNINYNDAVEFELKVQLEKYNIATGNYESLIAPQDGYIMEGSALFPPFPLEFTSLQNELIIGNFFKSIHNPFSVSDLYVNLQGQDPGLYRYIFIMTYQDDLGNSRQKEDFINVKLWSENDFARFRIFKTNNIPIDNLLMNYSIGLTPPNGPPSHGLYIYFRDESISINTIGTYSGTGHKIWNVFYHSSPPVVIEDSTNLIINNISLDSYNPWIYARAVRECVSDTGCKTGAVCNTSSGRCEPDGTEYDLTVNVVPEGSGSVTGAGSYALNEEYTLNATPNGGYNFVSYYFEGDNGSTSGPWTTNPLTRNMWPTNTTVTATFAENPEYSLNLTANNTLAGSNLTGAGSYEEGFVVSIDLDLNSCYNFVDWKDESTVVSSNKNFSYTMPAQNKILTAFFSSKSFDVSVASGGNGTVSGGGSYTMGNTVTISATPNSGFNFEKWTDGSGNTVSNTPNYNFTMPCNNIEYTAYFTSEPTYLLTLLKNPDTAGTVSGAGSYTAGTPVPIEATPNPGGGSSFINWTDESGTEITNMSSYLFTMPAENRTLTANFIEFPSLDLFEIIITEEDDFVCEDQESEVNLTLEFNDSLQVELSVHVLDLGILPPDVTDKCKIDTQQIPASYDGLSLGTKSYPPSEFSGIYSLSCNAPGAYQFVFKGLDQIENYEAEDVFNLYVDDCTTSQEYILFIDHLKTNDNLVDIPDNATTPDKGAVHPSGTSVTINTSASNIPSGVAFKDVRIHDGDYIGTLFLTPSQNVFMDKDKFADFTFKCIADYGCKADYKCNVGTGECVPYDACIPLLDPPTDYTGIYNWNDLNSINLNRAGDYILMNDLNSSTAGYDALVDTATGWSPIASIGSAQNHFSGELRGNCYKIKDFKINRNADNQGLFAQVTGTIDGVQLYGTFIKSSGSNIGGIAGQLRDDGEIKNSSSNIDILNHANGVGLNHKGGLVGFVTFGANTYPTIINSHSTGVVEGSNHLGGLVGRIYAENPHDNGYTAILNSSANSNVHGGDYLGGLVGSIESSRNIGHTSIIKNSRVGNQRIGWNYDFGGIVSAGNYIGGLVGKAINTDIEESYSSADINLTTDALGNGINHDYVGGLVGYFEANSSKETHIKDSYFDGKIRLKDGDYYDLFANLGYQPYVERVYANADFEITGESSPIIPTNITNSLTAYNNCAVTTDITEDSFCSSYYNEDKIINEIQSGNEWDDSLKRNSSDMQFEQSDNTYKDWDFTNIWKIDNVNNNKYAYLIDGSTKKVTLQVNPSGAGTTTGAGNYVPGIDLTISATANPGYIFSHWTKTGDTSIISTNNSYMFRMPSSDVSYTAHFVSDAPYSLTLTMIDHSDGGTLCLENPACKLSPQSYLSGENVSVAVNPFNSQCYTFNKWERTSPGPTTEVSSSRIFTYTTTHQNTTLNAVLNKKSYYLDVSVDSTSSGKGTVSPSNPENKVIGSNVTITATPLGGKYFEKWTDDSGNIISTSPSYTFTMPCRNVSFKAHFRDTKLPYIMYEGKELYISTIDNSNNIQWGCRGTAVSPPATSFTLGSLNTHRIVSWHQGWTEPWPTGPGGATCDVSNDGTVAARVCDNLTYDGYTDWYLPSYFELNEIYNKQNNLNITFDYIPIEDWNILTANEAQITGIKFGAGITDAHSVAYGNGRFIVVGGRNYASYSDDGGITWTKLLDGVDEGIKFRYGPGLNFLDAYSIAYGNGRWVVVGENARASYSDDGVNWNKLPQGSTTGIKFQTGNNASSVAYGNGRWVVVGQKGNASYSDDGIDWTVLPAGSDTGIKFGTTTDARSVAYGDGMWVVVGNHGKASYSYDGLNWEALTPGDNTGIKFGSWLDSSVPYSVAYGNGRWVVVGQDGKASYSNDGIEWVKLTPGTTTGIKFDDRSARSVAYSNGIWIAVGNYGKASYSYNGINWTELPAGLNTGIKFGGYGNQARSVVYGHGHGRWVVVGDAGKASYTSLDWTNLNSSYWSSSESNSNLAFGVNLTNGSQFATTKNVTNKVRCVRRFPV